MKLHFHGADYEHPELHLAAQDNEVEGRYRGSNLKIHCHKIQCCRRNTPKERVYRGVHY